MSRLRRLDEVCDITMGQAPDGASYNTDGDGLPLIAGAGDFGGVHPVPKKFTRNPGKVCAPGDIVLGIRASIGEKVVADRTYCLGRGVAGLRAKENLDNRYLWHWLTHAAPALTAKAKGATFKQVNREDIQELQIIAPPLPAQRRIAGILDKADGLRAKRRAALAQLDTLPQSIFLDMFGDPAKNPKGCPIAHMGDVCDVRDGTHDSPKYVAEGGFPLVTSKNVTGGFVDLTDVNYISDADYFQINKRSKVDRGDIILPMIGTIGSPVLVDHEPSYAIKNVALVKFTETSPSAAFVRHLLSGQYFDNIVSQKNRGGTQKFVSLGDLRAFPLPLPSKDEQHEFARRIEAVNKARTIGQASGVELNALFASLQHRAFRGEL